MNTDNAVATWEIDGITCWAVDYSGSLNGYARFPKRPLVEDGYDGIATYVPVHGGITYAEQTDDGFVYGFDTKHYNSDKHPINDPEWIKGQCAILVAGIKQAAKVERKYLTAKRQETKAKHAQTVLDVADEPGAGLDNFGVMLNVLAGDL